MIFHWQNVINFTGGNMADPSKDGLLLGRGMVNAPHHNYIAAHVRK